MRRKYVAIDQDANIQTLLYAAEKYKESSSRQETICAVMRNR